VRQRWQRIALLGARRKRVLCIFLGLARASAPRMAHKTVQALDVRPKARNAPTEPGIAYLSRKREGASILSADMRNKMCRIRDTIPDLGVRQSRCLTPAWISGLKIAYGGVRTPHLSLGHTGREKDDAGSARSTSGSLPNPPPGLSVLIPTAPAFRSRFQSSGASA